MSEVNQWDKSATGISFDTYANTCFAKHQAPRQKDRCLFMTKTLVDINDISYEEVSGFKKLINANQVFTTKDNCWIKSCELKEAGCQNSYQGDKLKLDGLSMSAAKNVILGWTETVCLSCTDSSEKTHDKKLNVKQKAKPVRRRELSTC